MSTSTPEVGLMRSMGSAARRLDPVGAAHDTGEELLDGGAELERLDHLGGVWQPGATTIWCSAHHFTTSGMSTERR